VIKNGEKMKKLGSLLSLIIASVLLISGCRAPEPGPAPEPEPEPIIVAEKETIQFDEQSSILIRIPEGWKSEQRKGTPVPLTARTYDLVVTPPSETKALLQISVGPTKNGEQVAGLEFEEIIHSRANKNLPDAVEESADFIELQVQAGTGKYCILTDASLVEKKLGPDEYRYVALIFAAYGNGCFLYATALFDEMHGKEVELMLNTVASIEPMMSAAESEPDPTLGGNDSVIEAMTAVIAFADKAAMFDSNRAFNPDYQVDADITSIGRLEDIEGYSTRTSSYNYKCKYSDRQIQEALAVGTFQIESDVEIEGVDLNRTDSIVAYIGSDGNWYAITNGEKVQIDFFAPPSMVLSFPVFVSETDKKYIKSFSEENEDGITSYEVIYDGAGYLEHRGLVAYSRNAGILQSGG
jgi:hypothetical protein